MAFCRYTLLVLFFCSTLTASTSAAKRYRTRMAKARNDVIFSAIRKSRSSAAVTATSNNDYLHKESVDSIFRKADGLWKKANNKTSESASVNNDKRLHTTMTSSWTDLDGDEPQRKLRSTSNGETRYITGRKKKSSRRHRLRRGSVGCRACQTGRDVNPFTATDGVRTRIRRRGRLASVRDNNDDDKQDNLRVMDDERATRLLGLENVSWIRLGNENLRENIGNNGQVRQTAAVDSPQPILKRIKRFVSYFLQPARNWLLGNTSASQSVARMLGYYEQHSLGDVRKGWKDYYKCLDDQRATLRSYLKAPTRAFQSRFYDSGQTVRLDCLACRNKFIPASTDGIRWMRRMWHRRSGFEAIPDDMERFEIDFHGTLRIYGIEPNEGGLYTCFKHNSHETSYLVGVEDEELRKKVFEDPMDGPTPRKKTILQENNLVLKTEWSNWSDCNRCDGGRGTRKRRGQCIVEKLRPRGPVMPKDVPVLRTLRKLECRSPLLPRFIAQMSAVELRPSELMVSYCAKICEEKKPALETVTDSSGNAIDVVEAAGLISVLSGKKLPKKKKVPTATLR